MTQSHEELSGTARSRLTERRAAARAKSLGEPNLSGRAKKLRDRKYVRSDLKPRKLHAAAIQARDEALEHLGVDGPRFQAAVKRYVDAVEVADAARREWEQSGRPMMTVGSMGQEVEHPFIRTMERLDKAAMAFGAALGLDPQSEKRLEGRKLGRPVGAVSAVDRSAPPVVRLKAAG